jgi:glycosyltransferase involved in cell wall biosynthesis
MIPDPRITVAIPIYNEEQGIPELISRVTAVLDALPGGPHEVVFADDGSRDRSFELLRAAADKDPRLVVVSLSRNFGHQAALSCALDYAAGDVVVPMDGDLQDTPETIPRFLAEYRKGYDVVYAIRTRRKEGIILRSCYYLFYRLMSYLANIEVPLNSGDFCLMSRRVVDELKHTPERHRYLRGLRTWVGFRQTGIEVERAARLQGESKYTLRKLLKLAFDGIFAFSVAPLRAATLAGILATSLASLFAVYSLVIKLAGADPPPGFTAAILTTIFLSGVQLMFLGVMGEYLGRIYEEIKRRPHYIVRRVVGAPDPHSERQLDHEEMPSSR